MFYFITINKFVFSQNSIFFFIAINKEAQENNVSILLDMNVFTLIFMTQQIYCNMMPEYQNTLTLLNIIIVFLRICTLKLLKFFFEFLECFQSTPSLYETISWHWSTNKIFYF